MNQQTFQTVLEQVYDGICLVDREMKVTTWNRGAERITGFGADEMLQTVCRNNHLIHTDNNGSPLCGTDLCPLARTLTDGRTREQEIFVRHKEGHRLPIMFRVAALRDEQNSIVGAVQVFSDNLSEARAQEELRRLNNLALLDPLTGLSNRRYLETRLRAKLDELRRYNWPFGALFVDIDRFKQVNDTYGHLLGDRAIQMVGKTLSTCARSVDTVGRWGGDEFLVIINNVQAGDLYYIAERARILIANSLIEHDGADIRVTVSVGATMADEQDTSETLITRADRGTYRSKEAGKNCVSMETCGTPRPIPAG
ncbi:MAG: diguanylate cyclase [Phycisphaerae bacterium]